MTAKEYLSQLRYVDGLINSKLEQITRLRELATKATSTLSDMPKSDSPDLQPMESIVVKLVDLQDDTNAEIDKLVDLKQEAADVLQSIRKPAYRILLEMRYFNFLPWSEIAEAIGCDTRSAYREHKRALKAADCVLREKGIR